MKANTEQTPTKKAKGFLKRRVKKTKMPMRQVSQLKLNAIFLGGLISLVALSALTIVIAFSRTVKPQVTEKPQVVVPVERNQVDNRLQLFLDAYVQAYFTVSLDTTVQNKQEEVLNSFYATVPEVKDKPVVTQEVALVASKLQQIEEAVATYRVTYETGKEEKQRITVLFTIPYGGDEGSYYVSGLPYFQAVKSFKAENLPKQSLQLSATDDLTDEEREPLLRFMDLFFTNYTTSQDNLNIVARDIQAINGAVYKGLSYSYFKPTGKEIKAYVQASFDIAGVVHSENFTFTFTQKEGGYFVETLEHQIPSDYMR